MLPFGDWCDAVLLNVNGGELAVLSGRALHLQLAKESIAAGIPEHYCSEEHIARNLERLGRPAAAKFIRSKLPTRKSVRSGDLGEIIATTYIDQRTDYAVPIKRLRWKDHRNMSMRGEDVVGIQRVPETGRIRFLKCEAKSRVTLSAGVITEARAGLDRDSGLPSPHALSFISARLVELGDAELADAIDDEQLRYGILPVNVRHLLFTFTGNDPRTLLEQSLNDYAGVIAQAAAGVRVATHATFVRETYDQVIANG
jgi:uncharacterized protein DUF1837